MNGWKEAEHLPYYVEYTVDAKKDLRELCPSIPNEMYALVNELLKLDPK